MSTSTLRNIRITFSDHVEVRWAFLIMFPKRWEENRDEEGRLRQRLNPSEPPLKNNPDWFSPLPVFWMSSGDFQCFLCDNWAVKMSTNKISGWNQDTRPCLQQSDRQMFPVFPLRELWSNWVAEARQPALSKFLILTTLASAHHHKSALSAILIIAQINEGRELVSVLRLCNVTNEVAFAQSHRAGGHAQREAVGTHGRVKVPPLGFNCAQTRLIFILVTIRIISLLWGLHHGASMDLCLSPAGQ